VNGASKIPTVLYYDRHGKVTAVGAEAMQEGIFEQAEENDWTKAEWYVVQFLVGCVVLVSLCGRVWMTSLWCEPAAQSPWA